MKQPQLSSFEIIGFNGEQNVKINFYENRKVLIAENGSGKTTILNMLYLCLTNNKEKLKEYNFQECILTFQKSQPISIKYNELQRNTGESAKFLQAQRPSIDDIKIIKFLGSMNTISEFIFENKGRIFFQEFVFYYLNLISNYQDRRINQKQLLSNLIEYFQSDIGYITPRIVDYIENLSVMTKNDLDNVYFFLQEEDFDRRMREIRFASRGTGIGFLNFNKEIRILLLKYLEFFNERNDTILISAEKLLNGLNIIFLPTYRRIENNLEDLFSNSNILRENSNINFGLEDVSSLFKIIKKNIDDWTVRQLAELNNGTISDMINQKTISDSGKNKILDKEYVSEIINILRKDISGNDKRRLLSIVQNGDNNDYLFLYLDKLSNIYELRDKISQDIINFTKVCNKYLVNKYFDYDKSSLEIKIKLKKSDKLIDLSSLSSGEKQIISLFAKLYIHHLSNPNLNNDDKKQYWIIFDEPELSLSMTWQRMLLEDIWNSGRCGFIFATTHSPFIFDNEFKFYTSHINECLTEL